jgi:hypothetical protein
VKAQLSGQELAILAASHLHRLRSLAMHYAHNWDLAWEASAHTIDRLYDSRGISVSRRSAWPYIGQTLHNVMRDIKRRRWREVELGPAETALAAGFEDEAEERVDHDLDWLERTRARMERRRAIREALKESGLIQRWRAAAAVRAMMEGRRMSAAERVALSRFRKLAREKLAARPGEQSRPEPRKREKPGTWVTQQRPDGRPYGHRGGLLWWGA